MTQSPLFFVMLMKGVQGKYLPLDRAEYWLEKHRHPIVDVPTQWHVITPVTVGWMDEDDYLKEIYSRIRDLSGDVIECGLEKELLLQCLLEESAKKAKTERFGDVTRLKGGLSQTH